MDGVPRRRARATPRAASPLLFRGLEGLERMVAAVRETGEPPPRDPELLALLRGATSRRPRARGSRPKKAPRRP